jgi:hypothetical protein
MERDFRMNVLTNTVRQESGLGVVCYIYQLVFLRSRQWNRDKACSTSVLWLG